MQELVIISGKGGTGKTSLTAAFAALAQPVALADCDVDAADLHLMLRPRIRQREEFCSGATAVIHPERCTQCGACRAACRFDAIDAAFVVDPLACEGCRVCLYACPVQAVTMEENVCGEWFVSDTDYGAMAHAALGVAAENSGKLVATVRQQAKRIAAEEGRDLILIDGSPGIGCPVISSIAGASLVCVVTEPTLSGLHDLRRVVDLTAHFNMPASVCVNKADINADMTARILAYCAEYALPVVGAIPYDPIMVEAVVKQTPLTVLSPDAPTARAIRKIWERLDQQLREVKMKDRCNCLDDLHAIRKETIENYDIM